MRFSLVAAVLLLAGCFGAPKIYRTWRFENMGLTVHEVNAEYMDATCVPTRLDDGSLPQWNTEIVGCSIGGTILILKGKECVLLHELCHFEGIESIVCKEKYNFCAR